MTKLPFADDAPFFLNIRLVLMLATKRGPIDSTIPKRASANEKGLRMA